MTSNTEIVNNIKKDLPSLEGLDFGGVVTKVAQYLNYNDQQLADALNATLERHREALKPEPGLSFAASHEANQTSETVIHRTYIDDLKAAASAPSDTVLSSLIQTVKDQPHFDMEIQYDLIHALNISSRNRVLKGPEGTYLLDRKKYADAKFADAQITNRRDNAIWKNKDNLDLLRSPDPLDQIQATLLMLHALALREEKSIPALDDEHRNETLMNICATAEKGGVSEAQSHLMDMVRRKYSDGQGNNSMPSLIQEETKKIVQPLGAFFEAAGITGPQAGLSL